MILFGAGMLAMVYSEWNDDLVITVKDYTFMR